MIAATLPAEALVLALGPDGTVRWSSVVRTVVIVEAIVVAGAMLSVLRLYGRAWRRRGEMRGSGPRAVMLMAASYAVIAALLALGILDNLAEPITWRVPGYGLGLAVGLVALRLYARDERDARRALDVVVGGPVAVVTDDATLGQDVRTSGHQVDELDDQDDEQLDDRDRRGDPW